MPYVRQKTWLPLAPRIRGLSLRESPYGFGRGMGQTAGGVDLSGLPIGGLSTSDLNLLGMNLCYDSSGNVIDCGGASPGLTIVNPGAAPSTQGSPVTGPNNTVIQPNTLAGWLSANQNIVLIGGGLLFGIALLKGLTHR